MDISREPQTLKLAQRFVDEALVGQKSLITGTTNWTPEVFEELLHCYVQRPDESNRTFDEKIADQLRDASQDAVVLFAELLLLSVLPQDNLRDTTKIQKVQHVLHQGSAPLELPESMKQEITGTGVFNGGQGYNSSRFEQLRFLVEFGCWFSTHSEDERRRLLEPSELEETIYAGAGCKGEVRVQRALCYLFAPELYPPIIGYSHLANIVKHFGDVYLHDDEQDFTLSRKVGVIQERIRAERGSSWDFYVDPDEWWQKKKKPVSEEATTEPVVEADETEEFCLPMFKSDAADSLWVNQAWLDNLWLLLNSKKQVIFVGPPGTGKTYLAQRVAKTLSDSEDRVTLVQFHPSYGYEDFFEGYRPAGTHDGTVSLALRNGPLKTIVEQALEDPEHPYFLVIDEINRGDLARIFGELYFLLEYRDRPVELMYSGESFVMPENLFIIGTMNSADRSIALVDAAMRRRFAFINLDPDTSPTQDLLGRWCEETGAPQELHQIWLELNQRILDHGGNRKLLIGPSYFMNKLFDTADYESVLSLIWESEILPLLDEMFIDHYSWVREKFALSSIRSTTTP